MNSGFSSADTIIVAAIVAIIAPSILAAGNARISNKRQRIQWERDDAVEARQVAREKAAQNHTNASNEIQNRRLTSIEDQSKVIHALVNSELTEAYKQNLKALQETKAALENMIAINDSLGLARNPSSAVDLYLVDQRIGALVVKIEAREAQQEKIDETARTIDKGYLE